MANESIVQNDTWSYGGLDMDTDEGLAAMELFTDYPPPLLNFAAVSCTIFMIIGIPGNLITIVSLARYKKVRNATAIFIINMSAADLMFCCINLPLAVSTFWTRRWLHGVVTCQFFVFARFVLSGVAVFTIVAITINRYIMISFPRFYARTYTSRNLCIHIACIWIGAIGSMIPIWVGVWGRLGMDPKLSFCGVLDDTNGHSPMKLIFLLAFIIPLIVISFCYGRIFCIVRKTTAKSRGTIRRPKIENDDSSFATSNERPKSQVPTVQQQVEQPIEHPRVQSLRPPSNLLSKVSIANDEISSGSSSNLSNKLNFTRHINLRKSQILNIAPTSKDKRLLTMISVIVIAFFASHLPITIIKVFNQITDYNPQSIIWSYLLRYLTACINPIIYVLMSHEYRKAYNKSIVIRFCKNQSCLPR